jgi:hypothetical protein
VQLDSLYHNHQPYLPEGREQECAKSRTKHVLLNLRKLQKVAVSKTACLSIAVDLSYTIREIGMKSPASVSGPTVMNNWNSL